ncbi:universal stress protein [Rhodococcus opacus]|uniref:universal stress protein n=1 Tax=Rhodococcus opacus TaxID=37919 RepID=UPI00146F8209|nr:universal stress protein [Rhodococcus opacus]MDJ0415398.1 universal stress protein [Rhodococcus opacus]MDV7090467.1 universal stress protein [Rhodococcus opacus]UNN04668.1 universal stress protein [Rhodococcus opacus]WKN52467.1 universal stress protein [Rhodococcus opacus]
MPVAVLHQNSDVGRLALAIGVREAALRQTELVVLHALSGAEDEITRVETGAVESAVRAALSALAVEAGVRWTVMVGVPDPDTTSTLLTLVEQVRAELLVVGSRHRSAVGKFLMGQGIQRLLLETSVPVLLVKS